MIPSAGATDLAKKIGFSVDKDGWFQEAHPKLQPVETFAAGVYLAGTCQGPKDIPDTVAQASGAAVKVLGLFSKTELATEPMVSEVDISKCSGCGLCVPICPYNALSLQEINERGGHGHGPFTRQVAVVNNSLCQGCGSCLPACRTLALNLKGFGNDQLVAEVDALCL
jgi:heterodisulfide reductase subunit A